MNQEKVGNFIKEIRIKNNLTQAELADKLGVTYQAVSKWENGKNVPDIATMKEISNLFNVDIDEIINGEIKNDKNIKKNNHLVIILILGVLLLIFIGTFIFHMVNDNHQKDEFEFKVISTTCKDFKINGSLAYNKDKSYIYISNIEFCGEEDTVYSKIECILYEKNNDLINKIANCHTGKNETLKEHLKNVKLNADNYQTICSKDRELYLEINATDFNGKITTYKVPLEVSNTCDN